MEVIEVLAENHENRAQKTFPLILPPPLMCSTPPMIKASRRTALAVWKLQEIQTRTDEQYVGKELLAKVMGQEVLESKSKILLFGLQIQNQNGDVAIHMICKM